MGASLTALLGYDVTDPRSPHSVHVASEADVPALAPWGRSILHRAVRHADDAGAVVVLDHGRAHLYLAAEERLHYRPPAALGLGEPPALVVDEPTILLPDGDDLTLAEFDPAVLSTRPDWPAADGTDPAPEPADSPVEPPDGTDDGDPDPVADGSGPPSVTVSPSFDVLVPAFDIDEQGDPARPLERHATETPSGAGTGTPSG